MNLRHCEEPKRRRSNPGLDRRVATLLAMTILFLFCCSTQIKSTALKTKSVKFKNTTVNAEIADTNAARELGLMNRHTLAPDAGMLFIFDNETQQSFWMKNTYVSLDMIFLSSKKEIVYIEHSATPLSEKNITPAAPAKYVLEVNAGYTDAHGIGVGDKVEF